MTMHSEDEVEALVKEFVGQFYLRYAFDRPRLEAQVKTLIWGILELDALEGEDESETLTIEERNPSLASGGRN